MHIRIASVALLLSVRLFNLLVTTNFTKVANFGFWNCLADSALILWLWRCKFFDLNLLWAPTLGLDIRKLRLDTMKSSWVHLTSNFCGFHLKFLIDHSVSGLAIGLLLWVHSFSLSLCTWMNILLGFAFSRGLSHVFEHNHFKNGSIPCMQTMVLGVIKELTHAFLLIVSGWETLVRSFANKILLSLLWV